MSFEAKRKKLRSKIAEMVDKCDSNLTPRICQFRSTDKGRSTLIDYIEKKVLNSRLTVLPAMMEVEKEFNHNIID